MASYPNRSLAKRYALALYRLAGQGGGFAEAVAALGRHLAGASHDWQAMAGSALLSPAQKKQLVEKIVAAEKIADKKTDNLLRQFFALLVDKGRLAMAPLILAEVEAMVLADAGQVAAVVTTAKPMKPADQKLLAEKLASALPKLVPTLGARGGEKKLDNNLVMSYKVDEGLLGGLTIMVESYNIDLSVKSKLQKLEQELS